VSFRTSGYSSGTARGLWKCRPRYGRKAVAANPNGELRGQLVESTNSEPTVVCPLAGTVECTSHDDTDVEFTATVADVDGDESAVVLTIDGVAQPEIVIPAASTGGTTRILSVTLNEPAGRKGEDWVIVDEDTVKLRASRLGSGTGRVYTKPVEATGESGNTSTDTTEVRVPKSRGNGQGNGNGNG
jgi:hypothetical protein